MTAPSLPHSQSMVRKKRRRVSHCVLITPEQVKEAVRRGSDTLDELPSPNVRWTARRKAAVVIAVSDRQILRKEACRRYQLSSEEFLAWEDAFKKYGNSGLYVARLQRHRRPPEE